MLPDLHVDRELFIAVHEDIQSLGRIRAVTKFLFSLFERDRPFLYEDSYLRQLRSHGPTIACDTLQTCRLQAFS